VLSPVISWIDDGKVRSAASARCGRLTTGRRPTRLPPTARSMRIGMNGRTAAHAVDGTTGRVTMHGAEWYFCDGCLPWQTASGRSRRPAEAPLVAIDQPSWPGAEAFRAGRTTIGPSLEQPTGDLPAAVAGGNTRAGARQTDGTARRNFGPPTPLPPPKKFALSAARASRQFLQIRRVRLPLPRAYRPSGCEPRRRPNLTQPGPGADIRF
jgi:hypothetical protein